MGYIIGSARIAEDGSVNGALLGDQNGREVATEPFYVHTLGWYVLEPKEATVGNKLAAAMLMACQNDNIGYSQKDRLKVMNDGINSGKPTAADCSSLVRACIRFATGVDSGNFTTYNEVKALDKTGLFKEKQTYKDGMSIALGSVLVSCKKGHTAIVVGVPEEQKAPAEKSAAQSFDKALAGSYKTTGKLYIRKKPVTGTILATMPIDSTFRCYGYYTKVLGTKWLYGIFKNAAGVSFTGFASSKYLRR